MRISELIGVMPGIESYHRKKERTGLGKADKVGRKATNRLWPHLPTVPHSSMAPVVRGRGLLSGPSQSPFCRRMSSSYTASRVGMHRRCNLGVDFCLQLAEPWAGRGGQILHWLLGPEARELGHV